ncbi:MAG: hypothetical protein QM731_28920 [Chitinophagaceae bacterium]
MKYLYILALLIQAAAYGQDLSGDWTGILPQSERSFTFKMETHIVQTGNTITGTSKYTEPGNASVTIKFSGKVNGREINIYESEVIQYSPGWKWCIKNMVGKLTINTADNKYIIEGTWTSNVQYNGSRYFTEACPPGKMIISKPIGPEASKQTGLTTIITGRVLNKETMAPVNANLTITGNTIPRQVIGTDAEGRYTFTTNINAYHTISITADGYEIYRDSIKPHNADKIVNNFFVKPVAVKKEPAPPVVKEATPVTPPPANTSFMGRKINVTNSITVNSDSIQLFFYDRGDIDNDTITVYYNKQLLLNKQRLTAKALTVTIPVNRDQDNELIMHADNLGLIPPNTALMVVADGDKRTEVNLSSDMTKSGSIIIRRAPRK